MKYGSREAAAELGGRCTDNNLFRLSVDAPDSGIYQKILRNWDMIAKPLDGMGRFEAMTAQIGAILETDEIDLSKKAVMIMCADNGIVAEGVSQSGQEVTAAVAEQMGKGASSVGKMAARIGADTIPVDIGINRKTPIPGVLDRKVRCGTRNFRKEPAMTRDEAVRAIAIGVELARDHKRKGYQILATGEMGIGNTTTSSAVAAALLKCGAEEVTGRGAGLSDEKLRRKKEIIAEALETYRLYEAEPLRVLETVGGLDIAGLAGICIGGALYHIPVVLDGVISMVAALLAERLKPGTVRYLLPSHKGKEPAVERLIKALDLEPVIDGKMALGEGTGAVMLFALLDMALGVYHGRTLFSDIQVEQYERYYHKA
ncbi:MAG: nicotinate-nucleotide--dimethylbenzimidazole phosphoribosyltransferase [Lachnospiraceae bacterium]|nr:nicotinate-nucleotide--dimethylbenzimidazole phosphoribosyltransferase [Butyrivibrio sp.]MCM1344877.1 nicotinate-nucleotide--dimethylbenzimidazole phosphoribosyltransferase [Muribaculaceae bacterium]MCM1411197.1 nicotinate-nucleotide--dimethylbenzimidazole phosphoribosyltransferase [Lachnospiraceae bacterium]